MTASLRSPSSTQPLRTPPEDDDGYGVEKQPYRNIAISQYFFFRKLEFGGVAMGDWTGLDWTGLDSAWKNYM